MEFEYGDTVEVTVNLTMNGKILQSDTRIETVSYVGKRELSFESGSWAKKDDCTIIGRELPVERWDNFKPNGHIKEGYFIPNKV